MAENRLQNVVITLDKVKHFLRQPGQPQGPPLRPCSPAEVAEFLWSGEGSVARRVADAAGLQLCEYCVLGYDLAPGAATHGTTGCAAFQKMKARQVMRPLMGPVALALLGGCF